jgi:hypothetical protein
VRSARRHQRPAFFATLVPYVERAATGWLR